MVKKYIPKRGDIVYLDFNPTKGHEQSGFRSALVLSSDMFNNFTKMVIICPITTNTKEFPTHYLLRDTKKIKGSVLCEHLRSIDYETRSLKYVEKCSEEDYDNIIELIDSFYKNKKDKLKCLSFL